MAHGKMMKYQVSNKSYSITQLLDFSGVCEAVASRSTEGPKRELLRDLLRREKVTPNMLVGRSIAPMLTYGSQRRCAGEALRNTRGSFISGPRFSHDENYDGRYDPREALSDRRYSGLRKGPLRNTKGKVVEGPRKGIVRKGHGNMYFRGERRSAKEAIRLFPRLRKKLDGGKGLKQSMLEGKLRKYYKTGIPESELASTSQDLIGIGKFRAVWCVTF